MLDVEELDTDITAEKKVKPLTRHQPDGLEEDKIFRTYITHLISFETLLMENDNSNSPSVYSLVANVKCYLHLFL